MLKSSEDWQKLLRPYLLVLDHDGWNKRSFDVSWNELITLKEFQKRVEPSTCVWQQHPEKFFDLTEKDL